MNLVISGHAHHLEFLQEGKTTYVIIGGFGGTPDPEPTHISQASVFYSKEPYGFLDLNITPSEANLVLRDPDFNEIHSLCITP